MTVTNSPVTVGQPIYITFGTDPGDLGNTAMLLTEREAEAGILWHSDPLPIDAGMQYQVVAPGISTPGTYVAGLQIWSVSGADQALLDEAATTFQVVGGAGEDRDT